MQVSLVAKKEEEKKRACLNLLLIRPSTQTERENRRRGGWEGSSHIGWIQGHTQSRPLLAKTGDSVGGSREAWSIQE